MERCKYVKIDLDAVVPRFVFRSFALINQITSDDFVRGYLVNYNSLNGVHIDFCVMPRIVRESL